MNRFAKKSSLFVGALLLLPVVGACAPATLSLAGDWRFEIAGTNADAWSRELAGKTRIHLPGTMDDAGLGPKNTNAPTLEGPCRLYDYAGPAWYQRNIEIPPTWRGKRVTLFLERCRWTTTVWLDDRCFGSQDSLIAPHVYDFGTGLAPGRHRLAICVDNTVKINLGRFVSALFGGTWGNMNGIVGRVELDATPPVWIDSVQVYPDVQRKLARVVVKIGNDTGKAGRGMLTVGQQRVEATWDKTGGQAEVNVDMSGAKLWDEFTPNLSHVTVKLGADERTVRFGMRELATKGTQFTMNGRPLFLRGTVECSVFPLTGYPPCDVKWWRRVFRIEKSYGLNFIRFHSWCPPEAAFEAADQEGIMIQAEAPIANVPVGKDRKRDQFIEAELRRMVDTYGNHPSFCLMTLGNEYGGSSNLLTHWVRMLIHRDPRHLYSSPSSGQTTPNRQWTETGRGRGVKEPGTERDLGAVVASSDRPIVGHEIGQWMYWPDFKEIQKWTGVMRLKNFELIRADMKKKHLLDLEPNCVAACGRFATLLYKEEIELLLRTPGYGGFSLLDLIDYPTQGTALVGPLDAFWDSKGFIAPAAFRRFCSSTVPLLRMPRRTYTSDETFDATAEIAHYGPTDLREAHPMWTIKDRHGREVASGMLPALTVPTGNLTELGNIKASLTKAPVPCKLTVSVGLKGTKIINDWDIWVYPARVPTPAPPGVIVCANWDKAKAALAGGKKVVFFPQESNRKQSLRGRFLPVFWSPVWFPSQRPNTMGLLCNPRAPLFAKFPTEFYSDWQWFNLMQHSRVFILDGMPADYRPLVQVIDNFARNHKLGVIFQGRVAGGELLVSGFDLPQMTNDPAARQLLSSLYAYAGSSKFKPDQELDPGLLDKLFTSKPTHLQALGAKARADSRESEQYGADRAIDGDPSTIWHTSWEGNAPGFPHQLVVQLDRPVKLAGFTALPRQDGNRNGWIKAYAFYVSNDGVNWGAPVSRGTFSDNANLKTVKFSTSVTARYVKLVALSGHASGPWASLAELDVLMAGK